MLNQRTLLKLINLWMLKKVNEARIMTDKYGIRGVPAIIVNGKYKTAQYLTGSQEKLLAVLDLLVEKERNVGQ